MHPDLLNSYARHIVLNVSLLFQRITFLNSKERYAKGGNQF